MSTLLEYVVSALVGIPLLAIGLFFTAFPGVRFVKVHIYLRSVRKELEPVARALGATTRTEWVTQKGQVMYFFVFPNEEWITHDQSGKQLSVNPWITLEVSPEGFNIYEPSFSPPMQYSPDFQSLIRAVRRYRDAGIRN
jgi:hypothetical protein